ncbi:CsbD family protein [Sinorhizobium fredii]|uniref:CsbD family protein n=1 Tax=Rhizobium fredii TaxID=380 RepID=UPI00351819F1
MDWNRIEGNWKQVKGRSKSRGKHDDLDQLEGKIQERYGIEKDRVRRDLDDWYSRQTWDW